MRATFVTEPGDPAKPNEDWALAAAGLAVILDGATARTDTGCIHGVAWYAHQLGAAIVANSSTPSTDLSAGLADAIERVAAMHPSCDLSHPGTPSAAVGIVRVVDDVLEYLVLGDVTIALHGPSDLTLISDDRVSQTAQPDRAEAEILPIGSPEKAAALLRMKHGELAARNREGGYWVSANDPGAARHALVGVAQTQDLSQVALLTDGAARVADFGLEKWEGILAAAATGAAARLIADLRRAERKDPTGTRWPRNKGSDDATLIFMDGFLHTGGKTA